MPNLLSRLGLGRLGRKTDRFLQKVTKNATNYRKFTKPLSRHGLRERLEHARKYFLPAADTFLPTWSLWAVGATVPFMELVAGALVVIGLFTRHALVSLGCVLAVVTLGHLLKQPLYPFHEHVIPRLAFFTSGDGRTADRTWTPAAR